MGNHPFDGRTQCRDLSVAFFITWTEFATSRSLPGYCVNVTLITFVGDGAARVLDDLAHGCSGERRSIMGLTRQWIRNVDRGPVEQAQ
jgi:hypothetical protein